MSLNRPLATSLLLGTGLAAVLLSGCPSSAPTASPNGSAAPVARTAAAIDADACEHFDKGPITAVTATDSSTAAATPLVSTPHTRFDITLPGTGSRSGFARFSVSKAGDYILYLNKATDLQVLSEARTPINPKESATSGNGCATVNVRKVYPLTVGTYYLQVGPTSEMQVNFVAIAADDAGDTK
jgi:hypothetical protein